MTVNEKNSRYVDGMWPTVTVKEKRSDTQSDRERLRWGIDGSINELVHLKVKSGRIITYGYCWRSRDELISNVLLWTPSHGQAKAGRPARTYIQQLCEDTECSPEDLSEAMNDQERWREKVQ